ncbi:MAG: hypothetical protein R2795_08290 [Saprospiraceae bacterium]
MEALEFSTHIEQGIIRLPEEFRAYSNAFVRIIILAEKPAPTLSKKEKLREIMLKMGEENIFSTITDAVAWQKEARNEWE